MEITINLSQILNLSFDYVLQVNEDLKIIVKSVNMGHTLLIGNLNNAQIVWRMLYVREELKQMLIKDIGDNP